MSSDQTLLLILESNAHLEQRFNTYVVSSSIIFILLMICNVIIFSFLINFYYSLKHIKFVNKIMWRAFITSHDISDTDSEINENNIIESNDIAADEDADLSADENNDSETKKTV